MSMKNYEAVFIVTPVLNDAEIKETVEKFENFLKENGADLYHSETWGMKKLAYPINKKTTGYYQLFEFKAEPTLIERFEIEFKRDEKVLRFLTVHLDKYGVEFNERRRNGKLIKDQQKTESAS
ncbi:30S ribosomal protein S6 [Algivirga pacifica]|uniref:Small ribosomal subunit protein bS6 n=1 Tax=Algivirga pacifica TaxID=1162670 RepID=A0ABP9DGG6_9BACT